MHRRCQFESRSTELTRNLVSIYRRATVSDMRKGLRWYPVARRIVTEWSMEYGTDVDTIAAVIAATSPQISWKDNLLVAEDILRGNVPTLGLKTNIDKARKLLSDPITPYDRRKPYHSLYARMVRTFPQGPKVTSFACNLAGSGSIVTVDTHAMRAALNDVNARYKLAWLPYSIFAKCYVDAASTVGRMPADFQAIIWCAWKRRYSPERKRELLREVAA